ncbi:MAG: chemotaxis protein CheD [Planctomycetota bacterium]|jgi:chemotaxis protein CheD
MDRKFVRPGEFCIVREPVILETLVGSCVSVCLYNFRNGCAAMNHFLRDRPTRDKIADVGEFGSTSTERIIAGLMAIDGASTHYRAMIFGGAAVLKTARGDSDIGIKNVDVALKALAGARIRVAQKEVFGKRGRRVTFETETGTATWRFAGDVGKRRRD